MLCVWSNDLLALLNTTTTSRWQLDIYIERKRTYRLLLCVFLFLGEIYGFGRRIEAQWRVMSRRTSSISLSSTDKMLGPLGYDSSRSDVTFLREPGSCFCYFQNNEMKWIILSYQTPKVYTVQFHKYNSVTASKSRSRLFVVDPRYLTSWTQLGKPGTAARYLVVAI